MMIFAVGSKARVTVDEPDGAVGLRKGAVVTIKSLQVDTDGRPFAMVEPPTYAVFLDNLLPIEADDDVVPDAEDVRDKFAAMIDMDADLRVLDKDQHAVVADNKGIPLDADVMHVKDTDGDELYVTYYNFICPTHGHEAALHFQATPDGMLLPITEVPGMIDWLQSRLDKHLAAGGTL